MTLSNIKYNAKTKSIQWNFITDYVYEITPAHLFVNVYFTHIDNINITNDNVTITAENLHIIQQPILKIVATQILNYNEHLYVNKIEGEICTFIDIYNGLKVKVSTEPVAIITQNPYINIYNLPKFQSLDTHEQNSIFNILINGDTVSKEVVYTILNIN